MQQKMKPACCAREPPLFRGWKCFPEPKKKEEPVQKVQQTYRSDGLVKVIRVVLGEELCHVPFMHGDEGHALC